MNAQLVQSSAEKCCEQDIKICEGVWICLETDKNLTEHVKFSILTQIIDTSCVNCEGWQRGQETLYACIASN